MLGVMLLVDGLGAVFGGLIQGILQHRAYAEAGYNVLFDPHSTGWAAGGVPCLIAGVYFVVGGNWVLENVFTGSGTLAHESDATQLLNSGELTDEREP